METEGSESFSLDYKNIKDIAIAVGLGALALYSSNTEIVNTYIGDYISGEMYTALMFILPYTVKKYLKDYSTN